MHSIIITSYHLDLSKFVTFNQGQATMVRYNSPWANTVTLATTSKKTNANILQAEY